MEQVMVTIGSEPDKRSPVLRLRDYKPDDELRSILEDYRKMLSGCVLGIDIGGNDHTVVKELTSYIAADLLIQDILFTKPQGD